MITDAHAFAKKKPKPQPTSTPTPTPTPTSTPTPTPTPYYKELHILPEQDIQPVALNLFRTFPMPVIVKPRGLGSSLGVSFASNVEELVEALNHAREFSEEVLVEEYLTGKEIISGFIDDFRGKDLYHLFPVEVKPQDMNLFGEKVKNDITPLSIPDEDEKTADVSISDLSPEELTLAKLQSPEEVPVVKKKHSIFDWITKHIGSYDHQSPANLKNEEKEAIEAAIKAARDVLGLRHFATADFIVHPRRGVYLLEINTQPGLHEHSPIYKSLDAAGVKHHEFLDHLLRLALKRGK
jgi:D-alanine-D-alanine ligase-like ATP-grasp enzyme